MRLHCLFNAFFWHLFGASNLLEAANSLSDAIKIWICFCLLFQADISTKADQLETEKQNLIQNIAKLEKQLVKEQKSRENLEVSHLSLLSRIEQMESIMDCEKNEVSENTF